MPLSGSARAFLLSVTLAIGCAPPSLTAGQWSWLRVHPELGEAGRQALLERAIAVGQSLERVRITWDGFDFEPLAHRAGDRAQSFSVRIPVGAGPVRLRGGPTGNEDVDHGRVLLTFRDGLLALYVRME